MKLYSKIYCFIIAIFLEELLKNDFVVFVSVVVIGKTVLNFKIPRATLVSAERYLTEQFKFPSLIF